MPQVLPSLIVNNDREPPTQFARRVTVEAVRLLFDAGKTDVQIASELGCSGQTIRNKRAAGGMQRARGPRSPRPMAAKTVKSRFDSKSYLDRQAVLPPANHPAFEEGRTIYPATVTSVEGLNNVLISGANHWKLGERIVKGAWSGFPIFALTLEERATCPVSCKHWRSCYGNQMNWSKRIKNDPAFEDRLGHELAILNSRFPKGFAVRLHVLGDFYSIEYVELWRSFLTRFPALRVFGFSARWDMKRDPIADALVRLTADECDRFAIRFSNAPLDEHATVSVEHPKQVPDDAVLCPQQTGQTQSCGTCALCWSTSKRIAFIQH